MKKVMLVLLVSLFCISFASAAIPADCLSSTVSLWKFDGDASDSIVASGNDGVGEGSVDYGFGKVNDALSLDSFVPLENIRVDHDSSLTPSTNKLSLEFWFEKTADSPGLFLISKQGYKILLSGTNIQAQIGASTLTSTVSIVSGNWYYTAVTWDGSDVILYVREVGAGSFDEQTDSLASITYGTDDLYVGKESGGAFNFVGLIDELAIYNQALTPAQISDHYAKGSGGLDYCYVSSGNSSGTSKNFSLAGCDVPGVSTKLPVGSCFQGEPYDGEYYCDILKVLHDTQNEPDYCSRTTPNCCPVNSKCEVRPISEGGIDNDNKYCYQRLQTCSYWTDNGGQSACEDDGCWWIDEECMDPNDLSLSCSIYTSSGTCEEDIWNFGQTGVGTEICGTFVNGPIILGDGSTLDSGAVDADSCKCKWLVDATDGNKCYLSAQIHEDFCYPIEDCNSFDCYRFFQTGACIDGVQEVNWTARLFDLSEEPEEEILQLSIKTSLSCIDGDATRSCGQPIVTVPFFGFSNLIIAGLLICLFYFVRENL